MSVDALLNRPATIVHSAHTGVEDDYGNPTVETTASATVCHLEQHGGGVDTEGGAQQIVEENWRCFLPADVTVDAGDQVTVDTIVFEVHGVPWAVYNPRTQTVSHIEAQLQRTSI